MEISINDIDHPLTVISGFESICNKDFKSPNAVYAQTVLKLNGCDLAAIAGQEGFGSAIKAGAKKVIEMIWKLIKNIKEFFFGSKGGKSDTTMAKVNTETKKVVLEIKALPNPKLEKLLKEAKDQKERLDKITSGEYGLVKFGNYKDFVSGLKEAQQASYKKFDTVGMSIVKFSQGAENGYKTDDLRKYIEKLTDLISSDSHINHDDKLAVIKTIEHAGDVTDTLASVRTEAKKLIAEMTPDLEKCTETLKRIGQVQDDDGTLTKQYDVLKSFSIQLSSATGKLVKLVQECERYTILIAQVTSKMLAAATAGDDKKFVPNQELLDYQTPEFDNK